MKFEWVFEKLKKTEAKRGHIHPPGWRIYSQAQAQERVSLKRALRQLGKEFENDQPTAELQALLKEENHEI